MSLTDKLLGREKLKERIDALKQELNKTRKEKEELQEKLESERERAKEAVAERQELNKRINRQQDKIESLKDEIRRKEYVEERVGQDLQSNKISRKEIASLLSKLSSLKSENDDLLTVFLPRNASIEGIDSEGVLRTDLTLNQLKKFKEEGSETGKVLFYCENLLSLLLKPPLPVKHQDWHKSETFKVSPIQEQLNREIGYIFLSGSGSGVALFGGEVEDFEIIEGKIKDKHKKGGFSQGRFERKREEEVKKHLDKVVEAGREFFPTDLKVFALSGNKKMVSSLKERNFLEDKETFVKKIDISKLAGKKDLKNVFKEFWSGELKPI